MRLFLLILFLIPGLLLMGLNLYGLTQPLRYPGLFETESELLRFPTEGNYTFEQTMQALDEFEPASSQIDTARELNELVNNAITHVQWTQVDPGTYRQLVPAWENFFLYAIGKFTSLPQFKRYHFTDYRRSLERGIGMCGDASMVLSSLLSEYDIRNNIIAMNGHVIVETFDKDGQSHLLDPDFGVELGVSLDELRGSLDNVSSAYENAGYEITGETAKLLDTYAMKTGRDIYSGSKDFMRTRYYFERVSYVMKWVLPAVMIVLGLFGLRARKPRVARLASVKPSTA